MKESTKESGKINMATILLLLICVIVVVCIIVVLQNQKKNNTNNESSNIGGSDLDNPQTIEDYKKIAEEYKDFKERVAADHGESYVLELTTFDNIYKNIDVSKEKYDDEYVANISQDEIKNAINEYVNLQNIYAINADKFLTELNLTTEEKIKNYETRNINDYDYIVTDIEFEDFKNALLNYMTEEAFLNDFNGSFKSLNGKVCYIPYSFDEDNSYEIIGMTRPDEEDINTYVVKLLGKSTFVDNDVDEETNEDLEMIDNSIILDNQNEENAITVDENDNVESGENQEETSEFEEDIVFYITSKNKKPIIGME